MDKANELFFLLLDAAPKALFCKGPDLSRSEAAAFGCVAAYRRESGRNIGMRELGRQMNITKSAATQIVSRIERKRLVRRTRDETDKRAVNVTVTAEGEAQLSVFLAEALTAIRRAMNILGKEDTDRLLGLIQKYIRAVKGELDA